MDSRFKILVLEPIHPKGIKILEKHAVVIQLTEDTPLDERLEELDKADAIISRGFEKLSRDVLEHAEKLKVIGVHGVGTDHIDLDAAKEKNLTILNTNEALTKTVAEFTIGLMITLLRKISQADKALRRGKWSLKYNKLVGEDLEGKTIGIIGLGRIGEEVARKLTRFNVEMIYYDINRKESIENELDIKYSDLEKLIKESDVISIHVPLTKETYHLISEKEFKNMKKGVYIINTSRGPVIDENALIKSLEEGRVLGAALDVFDNEPIDIENPLIKRDNVILTPHLGASSKQALIRMATEIARKVLRNLRELENVIT